MAIHKIEVFLTGEFTTIDIFLEGREIPIREVDDNEYYKVYSKFRIIGTLDIHVRLKGWIGMKWKFQVKSDGKLAFEKEGKFDNKGFITFTENVETYKSVE